MKERNTLTYQFLIILTMALRRFSSNMPPTMLTRRCRASNDLSTAPFPDRPTSHTGSVLNPSNLLPRQTSRSPAGDYLSIAGLSVSRRSRGLTSSFILALCFAFVVSYRISSYSFTMTNIFPPVTFNDTVKFLQPNLLGPLTFAMVRHGADALADKLCSMNITKTWAFR